jgi:hypothetical protein
MRQIVRDFERAELIEVLWRISRTRRRSLEI